MTATYVINVPVANPQTSISQFLRYGDGPVIAQTNSKAVVTIAILLAIEMSLKD
ncbi:hypothetical protein ACVMVB_18540 [Stenotrophomonas maltophilia]